MNIVPTSIFASPSKPASSSGSGLDAATFMKLFTSQLKNQNPMEPMDSASFLNQFAQITSVQTMTELQTTMSSVKGSLNSLQSATQFSQAESLLGHKINYFDSNGAIQQDQVDAIRIGASGTVKLSVSGGALVDMSAVQQVL